MGKFSNLYSLKAWRDRRADQLAREPLCRYCERQGRTVEAKIADHIIPHRGCLDLFWFGALQSLCASHHSSVKAYEEINGYSNEIDEDGYFIDERHPSNDANQDTLADFEARMVEHERAIANGELIKLSGLSPEALKQALWGEQDGDA